MVPFKTEIFTSEYTSRQSAFMPFYLLWVGKDRQEVFADENLVQVSGHIVVSKRSMEVGLRSE